MNFITVNLFAFLIILTFLVRRSLKLTVIRHCGDPYLVRLTLINLFGYSAKFHVFLRGDMDRELHDHPWPFVTWCLLGGYMEEIGLKDPRKPSRFEEMKPGQWKYRSCHHRHRVILAEGQYAVTIVFTGRTRRTWGFWRVTNKWANNNGGGLRAIFIPWHKLVQQRRGEDC
jgi:hypothetical protein